MTNERTCPDHVGAVASRIPPLAGLLPALLVAAVATEPDPAGLRFEPPHVPANGLVRLAIIGTETHPLTADRASRITILGTTNLSAETRVWPEAAGARTFDDGRLTLEHTPTGSSAAGWYFSAREVSLPPPVTVRTTSELRAAVASARPGSRVLLAPGIYPGGLYFTHVRGEPGLPVVIAAADITNPPVIQGGGTGMQFSDPVWLELEDLVFTGATGNGLNLDDGGSFDTPAQHITLRRLRVSDVGPTGNRDGIKLSGVVDFRVEDCVIERWGGGGSAVDMVGCHRGVIERNRFQHTPAAAGTGTSGVQIKGGSREIIVRRNRFEHAGARSLNLGGSTGLEFFRPPLNPGGEHAEAADLIVEGNTFIGSTTPIAFVGVDGAVVRFNTIYRPERWALRILQETTATGFVPCRNGRFTDNIVAFRSNEWSSGGVNIGANTASATFEFARNWWYCLDDPARSRPTLPVAETNGVYGQSPQFRDPANGDLQLQPGSPASGVGADAAPN